MVKIEDISNFFICLYHIDYGDCINSLYIQKLCYYAQGLYLGDPDNKKTKPLFYDNIFIDKNMNIIIPSLFMKYKNCKNNEDYLNLIKLYDYNKLNKNIIDFLELIWIELGQYAAWKLQEMIENENPYIKALKRKSKIISHKNMKEYFNTWWQEY